jgi:predicted acylesterase/phospholipase RssA
MKNNIINLTLSGNGPEAISCLGVIKYLEDNGYIIEKISASGTASLIGYLYAHGLKVEEIIDLIDSGLGTNDFELIKRTEFQKELIVCCTDYSTMEAVYFSSKKCDADIFYNATIASASEEVFFVNEEPYCLGSYSDPIPNIVFKKENVFNLSIGFKFKSPYRYIVDTAMRSDIFVLLNSEHEMDSIDYGYEMADLAFEEETNYDICFKC